MPNDTTGAPFDFELNTPGIGISSLGTWNTNTRNINENAMHKGIYDPTNVGADAFRATNHMMTGYARANEYAKIERTDTSAAAIGKLEAGVIASGDMQKATYDTNGDGKVDHAEVADEANSVAWASVVGRPSTLPNPNALTLQLGGAAAATYTGSKAEVVNVTPAAIGGASLVSGKVPAAQLPLNNTTTSTSDQEAGTANAVRLAKTEAIADMFGAIVAHNKNDNLAAHEDIRSGLADKADGGKRIQFTPELKTSDSNQDFIYSRQNGSYTLLGDRCFFDFDMIVTNMPQSQATGNISMVAPLPYVDMAIANPIAYNMVPSSSNIVGISFLSAGSFQAMFNDAPYATFNMAHINKISTTSFRLFGQINYYWR